MQSTTPPITKKIKGISLRLLVVILLFLVALSAFYIITDEAVLENENQLDEFVFQNISTMVSPSVTRVMIAITFFGSSYFLLPSYIALTAYYIFFRKNTRLSLNVSSIGLTSTGVLFAIKSIFKRHRPLDPLIKNVSGFSFPSGHSFSAFTFFGLLIYIVWQTEADNLVKWIASVFFFLFACAIAFSRVYLHVHFATDAIAGLSLCIMWLTISLFVLNKINFKKSINTV
jgi:undecaprenyl-diphosphatase